MGGIIDSIGGGGGLIALPTYLMLGLPVRTAYGCNKLQAGLGNLVSAVKYFRNHMVDLKIAMISAITALIGAYFGTKLIFLLPEATIQKAITIALPIVALIMVLRKSSAGNTIMESEISKKTVIQALIVGIIMGSSGNGKVLIVLTNALALVSYVQTGNVDYGVAIPAAASNIVGNLVGVNFAIKKGEKEKLEDNRGCVDEKAGQNAIPFVLLRLVALQKLAGAHRKVASLLNGSAGHDVGHENAAIVVALREDIVGIVRPGIDFDLVVRVE